MTNTMEMIENLRRLLDQAEAAIVTVERMHVAAAPVVNVAEPVAPGPKPKATTAKPKPQPKRRPAPTGTVACTDCGREFGTGQALALHRTRKHRLVAVQQPSTRPTVASVEALDRAVLGDIA